MTNQWHELEKLREANLELERALADEKRARQRTAERMKTLAMLGHKINNPLTALMGRAQILQLKAGTDPGVRKAAQVIEESSRRIADYVQELALIVKEGRIEADADREPAAEPVES